MLIHIIKRINIDKVLSPWRISVPLAVTHFHRFFNTTERLQSKIKAVFQKKCWKITTNNKMLVEQELHNSFCLNEFFSGKLLQYENSKNQIINVFFYNMCTLFGSTSSKWPTLHGISRFYIKCTWFRSVLQANAIWGFSNIAQKYLIQSPR